MTAKLANKKKKLHTRSRVKLLKKKMFFFLSSISINQITNRSFYPTINYESQSRSQLSSILICRLSYLSLTRKKKGA